MTPRERLLAIAPLLWGVEWQSAMARELWVHRRTLGRYASGKRGVDPALLRKLDAAVLDRLDALADALELPEDLRAGLAIALDNIREHMREPRT